MINATTEYRKWSILFLIVALWNLTGAIPGYFLTEMTYHVFFGRELIDPLYLSIYRGAWGSTLLYFIGYLFVARRPEKHTGIVILGMIGKIFFAKTLLAHYLTGVAGPVVLIVISGDMLFSLLFIVYLYSMYRNGEKII